MPLALCRSDLLFVLVACVSLIMCNLFAFVGCVKHFGVALHCMTDATLIKFD